MSILHKMEKISLSKSERLVLFEFLSRFEDTGSLEFEDPAEEILFHQILGRLESEMVEPFRKEYLDLLKDARQEVRGGERYACPCCGCLTLSSAKRETYEVCPVCYWEDDPIQFADPNYRGGANESSLNEGRFLYAQKGYSDEAMAKNVRKPYRFELPAQPKDNL